MTMKQYGIATFVGAAVALGDIGASQFNARAPSATDVLICCIAAALLAAKFVSMSTRKQAG